MTTFHFNAPITGANNEMNSKGYALLINDKEGNRVLSWQVKYSIVKSSNVRHGNYHESD